MSTQVLPATSFLEAVASPADLKRLSNTELQSLAGEIREELVQSLSKTGGHLASNLGIVEITLALHRVFNSPEDKILWDVGHQAYIHKMLTGRRHQFNTLRQYKGLSGFINPFESEHDPFLAGHSSTSISLGVGYALARDHFGQDHKVIAVIGDGGLTGGMALEALNHLGHIQKNVIIILNDNEMSISENLGGFSQYMKRIKETFFYKDIKEKISQIEIQLDESNLRPGIAELIEAVKKQAKQRFDTPGIVFEKLGVNYTGPVDGHDVEQVVNVLERIKDRTAPQLVHLITQKGKGYAPAEADSIKYHGVGAFSPEKIEPVSPEKPKAKSYSEAFTEALIEIAEIEPNVVAITPATAEGSGLVKFGKIYPERFFDVAICEQHAVTMAAGMAKAGLTPVVSIYSTFLQRALDQLVHDVAILNLPVIFGIDRGGLVEDGETHQGVFDIAFLRSIPNLTVLAPRDTEELRNMVYTAVRERKGPVAIRFPRDKAINYAETIPFHEINFRAWEKLHDGGNLIFLAYGSMVETAKQALSILQEQGKNATIVNARSAKPLDESMLSEIVSNPNNKIVTLEEGCLPGGFGSAVLEWAAKFKMQNPQIAQAPIVTLGIPDKFVEHGSRQILLDINGLSPAKVADFALKVLGTR
ncbi:MAG: 1-deoxy-D-xylulose-5-phosphate synthase [Candidatus Obscuribacterales bacterium]|nr:1-deoxy-D-xylulose-5-phosphate synthase [Candidatus Obscuribacterales bacterium]